MDDSYCLSAKGCLANMPKARRTGRKNGQPISVRQYIQQKMDEIWLEAVRIQEEDLSVDEETLDVLYEGRTEVLTTMVVSKLSLSQEDASKVTWILGGLAIGGGVRGEEGEFNEMLYQSA